MTDEEVDELLKGVQIGAYVIYIACILDPLRLIWFPNVQRWQCELRELRAHNTESMISYDHLDEFRVLLHLRCLQPSLPNQQPVHYISNKFRKRQYNINNLHVHRLYYSSSSVS